MMLLTKEIKRKLPALYATEKVALEDKEVVVKFFCPWGAATWYAVEGEEQEDGDWLFFGWADLGLGEGMAEMGYFALSELQSVNGPFGLKIERDMHFDPTKLGKVLPQHHYKP